MGQDLDGTYRKLLCDLMERQSLELPNAYEMIDVVHDCMLVVVSAPHLFGHHLGHYSTTESRDVCYWTSHVREASLISRSAIVCLLGYVCCPSSRS